jgi:hypothetical protein
MTRQFRHLADHEYDSADDPHGLYGIDYDEIARLDSKVHPAPHQRNRGSVRE